jgi:S1-C subfamily serine protease
MYSRSLRPTLDTPRWQSLCGSMRRTAPGRKLGLAVLLLGLCLPPRHAGAWPWSGGISDAVVKVYVTMQPADYALPWQGGRPGNGTGSAFYIGKRRLLTNAHVVSNARFLEVRRDGDARRYPARVLFMAHDCDLAALTVDAPGFFDGMDAIRFAEALPRLNDTVTVLGYPLGGDRLSLTQGVVSRIDYGTYAHSGVDQHLVLQVDAAINPGNSGGPVLFKGRVVGLAFQGLMLADNIGYAIPVPVIRHFLDDIADGRYDGYPELGVDVLEGRNPAMRRALGLPDDDRGVVVASLDPFGAALGRLQPGDVLRAIDGRPIATDGTIPLDGNTVLFHELLERRQRGDAVTFDLTRNGRAETVRVPLTHPDDPFLYRNLYTRSPPYLVYGGLVFCPLSRELLRVLDRDLDPKAMQPLLYAMEYGKIDGMHAGRDAFCVLSRVLADPVNAYTADFLGGIVETVNGAPIPNLGALRDALDAADGPYALFTFIGKDDTLILDAPAADAALPGLLQGYGVPAAFDPGDTP